MIIESLQCNLHDYLDRRFYFHRQTSALVLDTMANKTIYLIKFRRAVAQRAHFAIYIHEGAFPGQGTLIHVVGAPMAGYSLEIRANYNLAATTQRYTAHRLGEIPTSLAATMQQLASTVRPPGVSQNFMGPVDGVS